jgi:hypothetical protein
VLRRHSNQNSLKGREQNDPGFEIRKMACSECHQDKRNRLATHKCSPKFLNCAVGMYTYPFHTSQSPSKFPKSIRFPKPWWFLSLPLMVIHPNPLLRTTIPSISTLPSPSSSSTPRSPPTRRRRSPRVVCRRFRTTRSRSRASAFGGRLCAT